MMKKENIRAIIIAALIAVMYISGLPCAPFVNVTVSDVDSVCIKLLINIVFAMTAGTVLTKTLIPDFKLGFGKNNFAAGLKTYGVSAIMAFAIPCGAFSIGLMPFDYTPSVWKVLIEGVIYYIGVGIIEEFFCRGLLQNSLERIFEGRKNPQLTAVMITAVVFGLGHIVGVLGMPPVIAVCKIVWAIGLGIYLGAVYIKTRNLWLVSLFHFVVDLCGIPFCFTTEREYPLISAAVILCTFLALGAYGIKLLLSKESQN